MPSARSWRAIRWCMLDWTPCRHRHRLTTLVPRRRAISAQVSPEASLEPFKSLGEVAGQNMGGSLGASDALAGHMVSPP